MQSYYNDIRIVDSMLILVYGFGRTYFTKCLKGEASYGRCHSKKQTYFGFKFHVLTIVHGFLTDYIIIPVNIYMIRMQYDIYATSKIVKIYN